MTQYCRGPYRAFHFGFTPENIQGEHTQSGSSVNDIAADGTMHKRYQYRHYYAQSYNHNPLIHAFWQHDHKKTQLYSGYQTPNTNNVVEELYASQISRYAPYYTEAWSRELVYSHRVVGDCTRQASLTSTISDIDTAQPEPSNLAAHTISPVTATNEILFLGIIRYRPHPPSLQTCILCGANEYITAYRGATLANFYAPDCQHCFHESCLLKWMTCDNVGAAKHCANCLALHYVARWKGPILSMLTPGFGEAEIGLAVRRGVTLGEWMLRLKDHKVKEEEAMMR